MLEINIDTHLPEYMVSHYTPLFKNKNAFFFSWIMKPCRLAGDLPTFRRNPIPAFSANKKVEAGFFPRNSG
jgi:hypothetical protein